MSEPLISCPFCGDTDFDKVGLKMHLMLFGCEEFEAIDEIQSLIVPSRTAK